MERSLNFGFFCAGAESACVVDADGVSRLVVDVALSVAKRWRFRLVRQEPVALAVAVAVMEGCKQVEFRCEEKVIEVLDVDVDSQGRIRQKKS